MKNSANVRKKCTIGHSFNLDYFTRCFKIYVILCHSLRNSIKKTRFNFTVQLGDGANKWQLDIAYTKCQMQMHVSGNKHGFSENGIIPENLSQGSRYNRGNGPWKVRFRPLWRSGEGMKNSNGAGFVMHVVCLGQGAHLWQGWRLRLVLGAKLSLADWAGVQRIWNAVLSHAHLLPQF